MFRALICWWKGHDWPDIENEVKKAKGKAVYYRCCRCGEPEAAHWDSRTKTIQTSWG